LVIEAQVIDALYTCFDPEIPVNIYEIYELGLIYNVNVDPSGAVGIQMTLTSPNCPSAQELPVEVETKARGVTEAKVEVVFDLPRDPSKMSEAAELALGIT
jgi:metal-sulfur cluster biosynthetic enzyme